MDTLPGVMRDCFPDVPCKLNKADWYLPLPGGSEVWLGGLDDKERVEKILGKEYATILLNESSQIPWASRNIAVTRLAQKAVEKVAGFPERALALKMYYDCNPPPKSHWLYQFFHRGLDPVLKRAHGERVEHFKMNPRDNPHLPAEYIQNLERLPKRLRDRFLDGIYADALPGALWTDDIIERWRVTDEDLPEFLRIIVAVDPSGAGDPDAQQAGESDPIGIMVGALGMDGNCYVLEDLTVKAAPSVWGRISVDAYDRHGANLIVGERNFGGDMVRYVIQSQDGPKRATKLVTASRGKVVRADPVSALHEQGKIRFVGHFPELEEELLGFTTSGYTGLRSPNRADAFVWLVTEIFPQIVKQMQEVADSNLRKGQSVFTERPGRESYNRAQGWMR